jgi:hypothetical protein
MERNQAYEQKLKEYESSQSCLMKLQLAQKQSCPTASLPSKSTFTQSNPTLPEHSSTPLKIMTPSQSISTNDLTPLFLSQNIPSQSTPSQNMSPFQNIQTPSPATRTDADFGTKTQLLKKLRHIREMIALMSGKREPEKERHQMVEAQPVMSAEERLHRVSLVISHAKHSRGNCGRSKRSGAWRAVNMKSEG